MNRYLAIVRWACGYGAGPTGHPMCSGRFPGTTASSRGERTEYLHQYSHAQQHAISDKGAGDVLSTRAVPGAVPEPMVVSSWMPSCWT